MKHDTRTVNNCAIYLPQRTRLWRFNKSVQLSDVVDLEEKLEKILITIITLPD